MEDKRLCICGAKLNENFKLKYCKVCSSTYDKDGRLLVSRHNWNFKEFFSAVEYKKDKGQSMKLQHLDQLE